MFEVCRYTPELFDTWNSFVKKSKQGTFLFDRRYMDYHADRFHDHSLMIWQNGRLLALLPANACNQVLYSHQGLTYGGMITDEKATQETICSAFDAVASLLHDEGFNKVVYKPVPHIFHRLPAEEDLFAISLRYGARLVSRDASATISMDHRLRFTESRRSGLRKSLANGVKIAWTDDLDSFWTILSRNLADKYGSRPVHSVEEMRMLMHNFPDNIKLCMAYRNDGEPLGGTVLYITQQVVHTQYISASDDGKKLGALDLLFHHLINETQFAQRFFDFGTSAMDNSNELKHPLLFQKLGFGGRTVCYDTYEWTLS